jgi:hypothetical protein
MRSRRPQHEGSYLVFLPWKAWLKRLRIFDRTHKENRLDKPTEEAEKYATLSMERRVRVMDAQSLHPVRVGRGADSGGQEHETAFP